MGKIKGAIIIPTFYKKRHERGSRSMVSKVLFDRIQKLCGFSLVYTDKPNLEELDVAVIYAVPYHNRPKIPSGLFSSDVKLISFYADLPCYDNRECEANREIIFHGCDLVVGGFYEAFTEWYPQYVHKYELFPGCCYPYERYANLKMNPKPIMKCLLSGTSNKFYPFRRYIKKLYRRNASGVSKLMDISGRFVIPFKKYPKFLNKYFCAIATAGMHGCIVSKYFEIPAAGTLLLAERNEELDLLGFKPYTHYIPITMENVIEKIKGVLSHPKDYTQIRKDAMKFVQKNHSDINRALQFKDLVEELVDA